MSGEYWQEDPIFNGPTNPNLFKGDLDLLSDPAALNLLNGDIGLPDDHEILAVLDSANKPGLCFGGELVDPWVDAPLVQSCLEQFEYGPLDPCSFEHASLDNGARKALKSVSMSHDASLLVEKQKPVLLSPPLSNKKVSHGANYSPRKSSRLTRKQSLDHKVDSLIATPIISNDPSSKKMAKRAKNAAAAVRRRRKVKQETQDSLERLAWLEERNAQLREVIAQNRPIVEKLKAEIREMMSQASDSHKVVSQGPTLTL